MSKIISYLIKISKSFVFNLQYNNPEVSMTDKKQLTAVQKWLKRKEMNDWGDYSTQIMRRIAPSMISCGLYEMSGMNALTTDAHSVANPESFATRVPATFTRDIAPLVLREIRAFKGGAAVMFSDAENGHGHTLGEAMHEQDPEHVTKIYLGVNPNSGNKIYSYTVRTKTGERNAA
jgi:hypothetical protein